MTIPMNYLFMKIIQARLRLSNLMTIGMDYLFMKVIQGVEIIKSLMAIIALL
jgi:hypothetical protein